nr:hypothetical protein Iba_chr09eCG14200 [Ipomoea batatas]
MKSSNRLFISSGLRSRSLARPPLRHADTASLNVTDFLSSFHDVAAAAADGSKDTIRQGLPNGSSVPAGDRGSGGELTTAGILSAAS